MSTPLKATVKASGRPENRSRHGSQAIHPRREEICGKVNPLFLFRVSGTLGGESTARSIIPEIGISDDPVGDGLRALFGLCAEYDTIFKRW